MSEIIHAREFLRKVCEAVSVDFSTVRRVVLDIPFDNYVTVYVEQLGTNKLLEIDMQSDGIDFVVKDVSNGID